MRVWVDVYNRATGKRQGAGQIVAVTSASVKRSLDGAGSISVSFPRTDRRALALITYEVEVRIFVEEDEQKRELGRGIIRDITVDYDDATLFTAKGPDSMDALTRYTPRRERVYNNQPIEEIAADLISLVPGWSVSTEEDLGNQTARFDGGTVLGALIRMVEEKGIHIRPALALNQIEIGEFGSQLPISAIHIGNATPESRANDNIMFITRMSEKGSSQGIYNRVYALGGGQGRAALTLRDSTRTSPYPIGSVTENGLTEYYIDNEESQAKYGVIEKYVVYPPIIPIANTNAARIAASNALYDAAAADLERAGDVVKSYSCSAVKVRKTVRPGDKIRVTYNDLIERDGMLVIPADIDDWFWVMSVTEKVSKSGLSLDMDINTIDRHILDDSDILVKALEQMQVRNVSIQPYTAPFTYVYSDYVESIIGDTGRYARFTIPIDEKITEILSVKIRFVTRPLYVFVVIDTAYQSAGTATGFAFNTTESTQYPKGLRLFFNEVEINGDFGYPDGWNPITGSGTPNVQVDEEIDITQYILDAGTYENHSLRFSADFSGYYSNRVTGYTSPLQGGVDSSGVIELTVSILANCQSILPS